MVLGLLDPDPLVRGTVPDPVSDPDPAPDPSFPLPINVLSRLKYYLTKKNFNTKF